MHTITVTTCTREGHPLDAETTTILGDHAEAIAHARSALSRATISRHATDPATPYVHLVDVDDAPHAVITTTAGADGHTYLNGVFRAINHLTA